jgi:Polyketide cyclase / dehydrase and lipid transport
VTDGVPGVSGGPGDSATPGVARSPDDPVPGRWSFSSTARSAAPIDVVWPLIGEAARWREWSWMTRTSLLRPGHPDPDGVGALRRFAFGPGGSQEEVVAWDPPTHLGYIVVKGLPVRRYRADVDLHPDGTGTVVTWRGSFDEILPGTGPALRVLLARMTGGFAVRVSRYAERVTPSSGGGSG